MRTLPQVETCGMLRVLTRSQEATALMKVKAVLRRPAHLPSPRRARLWRQRRSIRRLV